MRSNGRIGKRPLPSLTKNASIFRQIRLPHTAPRPGNALPVAGFACVLPCGLRLQAQPRCARRWGRLESRSLPPASQAPSPKGEGLDTTSFVSPPTESHIPRCSPLARRHGSQNFYAPRYCLTASAGFACVLPCGLRLQAQPRCARRYLNERAVRRVRRRVVHLFTAVAPLQCIAGATSPRGFFESQRGAAGGPLARTPVRLKPCRRKRAFYEQGVQQAIGWYKIDLIRLAALGTFPKREGMRNDLFRPCGAPSPEGEGLGADLIRQPFGLPPSGGLPARSRKNNPLGCFPGARTPIGEGLRCRINTCSDTRTDPAGRSPPRRPRRGWRTAAGSRSTPAGSYRCSRR